jgi:hypothetical protein
MRQPGDERDDEAGAQRGHRVRIMPFGARRQRPADGNLWVVEVL